jgi:predicted HTH domain antitoxin
MQVTLELPDSIAHALSADAADLSRQAVEALAIESFREAKLTQKQVGELLGLSRIETENFLSKHLDLYDYDPLKFRDELGLLENYSNRPS